MTKNKKLTTEIGNRIRNFAISKYGSVSSLARGMDINQSQLQNYIYRKKNQPLPGTEVLLKLSKAGCDINWLLTGENVPNEMNKNVSNQLFDKVLKKYGITDSKQLEKILKSLTEIKNNLE